jgi:2-polyprenyl-6-methoxyphenol hydroxylase-like FAD-dependent oxidoreductase
MDPLASWSNGRLALLGDAAHALRNEVAEAGA